MNKFVTFITLCFYVDNKIYIDLLKKIEIFLLLYFSL